MTSQIENRLHSLCPRLVMTMALFAAMSPVFSQTPYTLEEVAASGTAAPAATYQAFYVPSINQGGTVAFAAIIGGPGFGSAKVIIRDWVLQGIPEVIYYMDVAPADPRCVQAITPPQRSNRCIDYGIGDTVYLDNADFTAFEGWDPSDSPTDVIRGNSGITTPMIQETVAGATGFAFPSAASDVLRRGDYNNFGQVTAWMDELSNGQPTGCSSLLFSNDGFLPPGQIGLPTTAVPPGQQVLDTCNPPPVFGRSEPWVAGSFAAQRRSSLPIADSRILVNGQGTLDTGSPGGDPISGLFMIDPTASGELEHVVDGDFLRDDFSMDINESGQIVHETPMGDALILRDTVSGTATTIVNSATFGITSFNVASINFDGQVAFSADTMNGQALYFWRPGTLVPQVIIEANGAADYNGEIIENVWFGKDGFSNEGDIAVQIRTSDGAGTALGDYILKFVQGILPPGPDIEVFDNFGFPNDLTINFGDIEVGRPFDTPVTISNAGSGNLTLGQIAQIDRLDPPYSILNDGCSQQVLAAAQTCDFFIRFLPTVAGTAPADLFDIPSDDPDEPSLSFLVTGNGVAGPPAPGELRFEQNAYTVGEGDMIVELTILRENGSAGAVSVDLSTMDGTATDGQDYNGFVSPVTIDFADQETQRLLAIDVLDDALPEQDETFSAMLANATGGATIGSPATSTVTITANDTGTDLEVGITTADLVVTQLAGGRVNLRVNYEVTATNNGPDSVTDALVRFPIPPVSSMSYVSDDTGGRYNQNQLGQWIWDVGVLDAGQTRTLMVVLEKDDPDVGEAVTTGAEILTSNPVNDPDTSNNTDSVTLAVGGVDLSVSISDRADPVESPGANMLDDAIYDVQLGYASVNNEVATNVIFDFDVGGQITDISPLPSECTRATDGRSFGCAWATFDTGIDFVVTVSVSGGITVIANAMVAADNLDPDLDNNSDSEQTRTEDVLIATRPGPRVNIGSTGVLSIVALILIGVVRARQRRAPAFGRHT